MFIYSHKHTLIYLFAPGTGETVIEMKFFNNSFFLLDRDQFPGSLDHFFYYYLKLQSMRRKKTIYSPFITINNGGQLLTFFSLSDDWSSTILAHFEG